MEDKKQTLAKLYALRAGMSAISLERDVIAKLEQKIETEREIKIDYIHKGTSSSYLSHVVYYVVVGNDIDVPDEYVDIIEEWQKCYTHNKEIKTEINKINTIKSKRIRRSYENRLMEIEAKNKQLEIESAQLYEQAMQLLREFKNRINESEKKYIEQQNDLIKISQDKAREIAIVLQKNYSEILDVRDWENVDLIIYYFETNRAESIKEALVMVDAQKAVGAIVGAINNASREISSTIRAFFTDIVSSFS